MGRVGLGWEKNDELCVGKIFKWCTDCPALDESGVDLGCDDEDLSFEYSERTWILLKT